MNKSLLGPVIIDVDGLALSSEDKELLANPWVGGIIFFSRNYKDQRQLRELVSEIRAINPNLVISIDHEGGRVQRFRNQFTSIPAMQKLGAVYAGNPRDGQQLALDVGWLLASELLAFDIDISFAPVIDVDDHLSDIIGERSFSAQPDVVVALAQAFISGMHEAGMAVTGKHFPGHGGVKADSHLELPVDDRQLSEIEARDLKPFMQLAPSLDAVMPAHILFPSIDPFPVGYSRWWLQQMLRTRMQYKGVIFSDDLSMEGAVVQGDYGARALTALGAGCDVVLACNNRSGALQTVAALAAHYGEVTPSRLESMRARKRVNWEDLIRSERWQQTAARCLSLS